MVEGLDSPTDIAFAGAARQAQMLRAGEISAGELMRLHLERIERLDPRLNAFRVVFAERALAAAREAEERLARGEELPLLGIPIGIKDEMEVAGEVTSHGTDAFTAPAVADAEVVRRLRAAGAIVVGLTLLPELSAGSFTESATYGVTRNPWNLERTPGGSSGGSAAAVTAGLLPIASAGDGAGSIRIPAAACGLFGLKPQSGRVPDTPSQGVWRGMMANGCVSRTVADTALWLDVVAGDSGAPLAPPAPERPFAEAARRPPGKLRIAWSAKPPRALAPTILDPEVDAALAGTAELLRGLGHQTSREDPAWGPIGDHVSPRFLRALSDGAAEVPAPGRLAPRTRGFARLGRMIPDRLLRRAIAQQEKDARRVGAIFDRHDLLMTPVMGTTAPEVGRWEGDGALRTLLGMSRLYPYCIPWNHLGNPAMSVPAGFAADGMPLAVQVIGRPGEEATLLSLAAQIEAERPWAEARPPLG
jgi:amidase